MLYQLTYLLLFLAYFNINGSAQELNTPDYQLFIDDSLVIYGDLSTRYQFRPHATIDIDDGDMVKKFTFIFNSNSAFEPRIDIKEKDSTLFMIIGYNQIGDTLIIERDNRPGYYVTNFRRIKGKTVQLYYRNEGFQQTPTLLGTLIVKND